MAFAFALFLTSFDNSPADVQYEFTSFTVVESIIPSGMGRSRIIHATEERDYREFTTVRTDENQKRNKSDRSEIRLKNFEETKILNFFSAIGIRFQNIAANDAVVNSKVQAMLNEGWELVSTNAGVESVGDKTDTEGIYITRATTSSARSKSSRLQSIPWLETVRGFFVCSTVLLTVT